MVVSFVASFLCLLAAHSTQRLPQTIEDELTTTACHGRCPGDRVHLVKQISMAYAVDCWQGINDLTQEAHNLNVRAVPWFFGWLCGVKRQFLANRSCE